MPPATTRPPEPTPISFRKPLWRYFSATRPAFLSVTLIAVLLGLATAYSSNLVIDPAKAVLTLIFALCAHAGVNVLNDYYDALNGSDAANTERLFPYTGGSRFIQNGVMSLHATRRFGFGLLAVVIPAGLWLTVHSAPPLLAIGFAGLLIGWAYSAPPLQLMCRGLGELAILAAWLLVVVGSDFVQRGDFSALPLIAGLPYALLVVSILYINQFPDRRADAEAGKRTLVVRLGPQRASWGYVLLILLSLASLLAAIATHALPTVALIATASLIPAWGAARTLILNAHKPALLAPAIRRTILAANLCGLLLVLTNLL